MYHTRPTRFLSTVIYSWIYYQFIPINIFITFFMEVADQSVLVYISNSYDLSIHQDHITYHIYNHIQKYSIYILHDIYLYQSIFCPNICIYNYSNAVYHYKHLNIFHIYMHKFHAVIYNVFH